MVLSSGKPWSHLGYLSEVYGMWWGKLLYIFTIRYYNLTILI